MFISLYYSHVECHFPSLSTLKERSGKQAKETGSLFLWEVVCLAKNQRFYDKGRKEKEYRGGVCSLQSLPFLGRGGWQDCPQPTSKPSRDHWDVSGKRRWCFDPFNWDGNWWSHAEMHLKFPFVLFERQSYKFLPNLSLQMYKAKRNKKDFTDITHSPPLQIRTQSTFQERGW